MESNKSLKASDRPSGWTFADWDRPPHNRWSFQHVPEFLPTAVVRRGKHSSPLVQKPTDLDGLLVSNVGGGKCALSQLLKETYTDGFLVIKDGSIVFERYFNGMEPSSLHLSQSVAKSFVGALVGILISQGLMNPKTPITDYLPELEKTAWKGATLQHVLDMTTGVSFSENYTDPYSDIGRVDVASGWKPPTDGAPSGFKWPSNMWELALDLTRKEREHGSAFRYRSIETDVLAFCMERVTGMSLSNLLSELIWKPVGMSEDACFTVDRAGFAIADGGLNASLRDYARFGLLMLTGGDGIIPAPWIEQTRNADHGMDISAQHPELAGGAYHNQFWIEDQEHRSLMCQGVFGQLIYISWQYNMVVAKVSSWPDFISPGFGRATRMACHTIGRNLAQS